MRETPPSNGPVIAAILAASTGLLLFGATVLATEVNDSAKDAVFTLGKAWVPGAEGIGPYSGKETVLLLAWLATWAALHPALRMREVPVRPAFAVALAMLLVAVLLVWPPTWHLFEP